METAAPFNWHRPVYELDPNNASNNGYKNEDLIVWMRAAAFPSFRKLYRRIDHQPPVTADERTPATSAGKHLGFRKKMFLRLLVF